MFGTCGHEITKDDERKPVTIKSYAEGRKAVSIKILCKKCRKIYAWSTLHSRAEIIKWLSMLDK